MIVILPFSAAPANINSMQPEELKLLELLQADEEAGTIYFKNRRMLIFDSDAMGFLRKGLIESMGIAAARRILAQFGYARGYRDALTMKESFDWKTLEDLWRAGTRLHALEGIVGVNPVLFEFDKDAGIFHAEAVWINSYEAEQHLKHIGKSDTPVCWTLMGYAGGYSSAVLGGDVIYFETECLGKGDGRCYVVGRSMLNDPSEAVHIATELYHIQDFDKEIPKIVADRSEIQSLMRELEQRSLALAEQEEKVRALESQVFYLQESINQNYKLEELVGVSPTFKRMMKDVETVAPVAATVLMAFVEDPPYIKNAVRRTIDYIGFGIMALWLASLQIMLDKGQDEDWFSSSWITGLAIISVLSLAAFVVWELKSKEPVVNLRVLKNRNFAVGTFLIMIVGIVLYGTTALLPLFLQNLLGYSALQSGIAVSPRGLGSLIAMIVVARLIGMIDNRWLIILGFAMLGISVFVLGGINLDIAPDNILWPIIISGAAMGFIFVPLSTMAVGTLRQEEMGNATGLYNLMRNIGGSIGISAVTTMLARGAQAHQALMIGHATPYDAPYQQQLHLLTDKLAPQFGAVKAAEKALGIIYGTIVKQAQLAAFIDNFRLLGIMCLLSIAVVFLLKKVSARGGTALAH